MKIKVILKCKLIGITNAIKDSNNYTDYYNYNNNIIRTV